MHRGGWFMRTFPALWAHILDGMRSQPGSGGDAGGALNVRCVELHHYATGGHLLQPKHRDNGSALTISVMLSDPASTSGGAFVTYDEGAPVVHALGHGDAILFHSEKLHNVCTVTSGVRQALVVELWEAPANSSDRFR